MFAGCGGEDDDTEPMDTDAPWDWFYQAECGVWHKTEDDPVNPISSSELEMFYLKNPCGSININTAEGNFKIDFYENLKINLKTGLMQRLKRSFVTERIFRCKCEGQALSLPAYWEKVDPKTPYKVCTLNRQTSEFKKVETYVREIGLLVKPLKAIYRIQNVDLWELYCRKKSQLMRINGQSNIDQQWLFHGTAPSNVHNICLYNFDCRISDSRRHGHLYGKGTYFAKHAAYADKYSVQSQGWGTQVMFLARVIVGKYTTGQKDLCKPDGDQNENIHDSCVDDALCPRIFVIFNSNQIYPEYVLEYGG